MEGKCWPPERAPVNILEYPTPIKTVGTPPKQSKPSASPIDQIKERLKDRELKIQKNSGSFYQKTLCDSS
jgi:hypothetical protein